MHNVCIIMFYAWLTISYKIVICIIELLAKHKTWMCYLHFAKLNAWSCKNIWKCHLSFAMLNTSQCTMRVRLLLLLIIYSIEFIVIVCKHTLINTLFLEPANTHVYQFWYLCMYTWMCVCMSVWLSMYGYVFLCVCTLVWWCMFVYTVMYVCLNVCKVVHGYVCMHAYAVMIACIYACMHGHICCMYGYLFAVMHDYICIYSYASM